MKIKDNQNREWLVIIESKAEIFSGYSAQESLHQAIFDQAKKDPQVLQILEKIFFQLSAFVAFTGFSDAHYNNVPLENTGCGIALIDMDFELIVQQSKFTHEALLGIIELLFNTDAFLHEAIFEGASYATTMSATDMAKAVADYFQLTDTGDYPLIETISPYISSRRKSHCWRYKGMAFLEKNESLVVWQ